MRISDWSSDVCSSDLNSDEAFRRTRRSYPCDGRSCCGGGQGEVGSLTRGAAFPAPLRAAPFERGCDESRASPWNGRQAQLSSGIPALIAGNSAALTLIFVLGQECWRERVCPSG